MMPFGNGNYGQQTSYNYGGMNPQQAQKRTNALSNDEIKELVQNSKEFSLALSREEVLRGICTHRSEDGTQDTLEEDPLTGGVRCKICGYRFRIVDDTSPEQIQESVDNIVDILQTIKYIYQDLPIPASREFFQIIPLLEKVPKLFDYAIKNFDKHNMYNSWNTNTNNMGAVNMFKNLSNIFAGSYQPQQQGFSQQMNPPYGNGAPQMNMPAGYPSAAYQNPFMGQQQAPAAGYTPQTMNYQYNPNQQQAQPAAAPTAAQQTPVAPATDNKETTVTQTVNA